MALPLSIGATYFLQDETFAPCQALHRQISLLKIEDDFSIDDTNEDRLKGVHLYQQLRIILNFKKRDLPMESLAYFNILACRT